MVTAARGPTVLRQLWGGGGPSDYSAGTLPGETPEASVAGIAGLQRVLAAQGFALEGPDGWLARGTKWDVMWTDPDPDRQPEAHRRLCFGPLRRRALAAERAYLEAVEGPEAAAAYDELEDLFPPLE